MRDLIQISELEVFAKIGCSEKERHSAQKILLNLELEINGSKAALSRDLKDSVCYLTLSKHVRELVAVREWALVEELVYTLADSCLAKFNLLEAITVEVRKFVLPATAFVSFSTRKTRLESE